MKTFVVKFFLDGHDEAYQQVGAAIEWSGGLWLVLEWLESNTSGERTPMRLLRIDTLRAERVGPAAGFDYLVPNAIPIALFEGRDPPESPVRYEVADYPALAHIPASPGNH